jgi:hypothetical protein
MSISGTVPCAGQIHLRWTYFRSACAPSSKFWAGRSTRPRASEDSKHQRHHSVHLKSRIMLPDKRGDDHSGTQSNLAIKS